MALARSLRAGAGARTAAAGASSTSCFAFFLARFAAAFDMPEGFSFSDGPSSSAIRLSSSLSSCACFCSFFALRAFTFNCVCFRGQ